MYVKENFEIGTPILFFQSFNIDFGVNIKYLNFNNRIQYRYLISEDARIFDLVQNKEVNQYINDGYLKATIFIDFKNDWYPVSVHRVMCMTFRPISNPEEYQVNHKDGNKLHDFLYNLEWCTPKENIEHAWLTGLSNSKGDNHPNTLFSEAQIQIMCEMIQSGCTYQDICREFNIVDKHDRYKVRDVVTNIIQRETYTYISENYVLPSKLPYDRNKRLKRMNLTKYDIINICEMLKKNYSYQEITDIIVQRSGADYIDVKNLLYDIVTGRTMQTISEKYKIQKPKSEKEPLFTENQIHKICKMVREGKDSYIIMNELGYDLNKFDDKRKHCYINCISNIRKKKSFKKISDLYF